MYQEKDCEDLSLWNTRANEDATKVNPFHTFVNKGDWYYENINKAEWISENQIALGFGNGTIEIRQIDEGDTTNNSRVVKKFHHGVSRNFDEVTTDT